MVELNPFDSGFKLWLQVSRSPAAAIRPQLLITTVTFFFFSYNSNELLFIERTFEYTIICNRVTERKQEISVTTRSVKRERLQHREPLH